MGKGSHDQIIWHKTSIFNKRKKDTGNVVHLYNYSVVKNNSIMKFADKWVELEKYHPELGNPDPKLQTWYVCNYKGILAIYLIHIPRVAK